MNYLNSQQYQVSQSAILPVDQLSDQTKQIYRQLIQQDTVGQPELQVLAKYICVDLDMPIVRVNYGGREPHRTRNGKLQRKTHGDYRPGFYNINLYKYTAVKKKLRAVKSTVKTLLHELCHHFDFEILGLPASPHTTGFYKRISQLEATLRENQ